MPSKKYAHDIDLLLAFAIRQALIYPVSSDPGSLGSGHAGLLWFNTTSGKLKVWDGTTAVDFLARANHTGTQLASTISDLASVVKAYRLDEFAVPTADVSMGSRKITSLADGVGANDGINKGQLDAALAALVSGQTLKGAVKVAATSNVNISSPGATIDSISMSNGDIALLTAQSTGSQDGPYVYNGSGSAMTRATNWDTSGEAVLGSYWVVEQGTKADQYALLTNDTAITLGTTTPTFTFIGGTSLTAGNGISITSGVITALATALGGVTVDGTGIHLDNTIAQRKVTGAIPTATSGAFTISGATVTWNHALNNKAAKLTVVAHTSPVSGYTDGEEVSFAQTNTDANNTQFTLPANPASNNWFAMIEG